MTLRRCAFVGLCVSIGTAISALMIGDVVSKLSPLRLRRDGDVVVIGWKPIVDLFHNSLADEATHNGAIVRLAPIDGGMIGAVVGCLLGCWIVREYHRAKKQAHLRTSEDPKSGVQGAGLALERASGQSAAKGVPTEVKLAVWLAFMSCITIHLLAVLAVVSAAAGIRAYFVH